MANTKVKAEAASAAPATEKIIIKASAPVQDVTVPAPEKKHRVKKVIRSIEELHNVAAKKMSPDETAKYIDFMRDECTQLQEQLRSMTLNAQSSYQKANRLANELERVKRSFAGEIAFVKQAVSTCYATVLRASVPDMNKDMPTCCPTPKEG